MFTPKKILVPTDFSESADKAVEHAADIAAKYHAKVVVLHVVEENVRQCAIDYLVDYCISDDFVTQFEREIMRTSNERLQKQIVNIKGAKVDIEYEIRKGEPADIILDEQVKLGADLIVIASHGKVGAAKHAIGGVTDKVVRSATCNVMVNKI
ncbi:MAG: universal stress protein [Desulfomonilia bacterium]|jgi:nucleotide-binding universal stress UspA family protein